MKQDPQTIRQHPKIEKLPWTHHGEYFKIAFDHNQNIRKLKDEHDKLQKQLKNKKKLTEAEIDLLAEKNDAIGRDALIVIIFCALSLEAYINYYSAIRLSKNYHSNYLDKLDLLSKWIVIPRLITGKQMDSGSKPIQNLSWLVSLRNKLVHYKAREIPIEEIQESDFFWDYDADKAIKTVGDVMLSLKKLDKKADIHWLEPED